MIRAVFEGFAAKTRCVGSSGTGRNALARVVTWENPTSNVVRIRDAKARNRDRRLLQRAARTMETVSITKLAIRGGGAPILASRGPSPANRTKNAKSEITSRRAFAKVSSLTTKESSRANRKRSNAIETPIALPIRPASTINVSILVHGTGNLPAPKIKFAKF